MDDIALLKMLEDAVGANAERFSDLRERADQLYADRVRELMAAHRCDLVKAQYLAGKDSVASKAYEMGLEFAERERRAIASGLRAAAYLS